MKNATLLLTLFVALLVTNSSCEKPNDCSVQVTINAIIPSSNPAGYEVILEGANLTSATTIRFGNEVAQTRFSEEVGLIATVPDGLSGVIEVTAEEGDCIGRRDFEVLTDFPDGTPINPNTIVIPGGTDPGLPGGIGNRWFNVFDPDHVFCIVDDNNGNGQNITLESQECHQDNPELIGDIVGTVSFIYNEIEIRVTREYEEEIFDGEFIDPTLVNSSRDFVLLLTSRKTGRQLALHAKDSPWDGCPAFCN